MSPSPRLRRTPGVVSEELDGRLLLLSPDDPHVLALDDVASTVWALLDDAPTEAELVTAVAQRYNVPVEQVAADVAPALEVLRRYGVLA